MALKFEDIQFTAPSRRIESITNTEVDYRDKAGNITLTIPVKIVELEGGRKGMVSMDNYALFHKSLVRDEEGYPTLPETWKVGSPKNGLPMGYWYDSESFGGSPLASLRS